MDLIGRQAAVAQPKNTCENTCEIARTANDCISRQAAIDAAIEAADEWDGGYNFTRANMIADAINNIAPSAQPERRKAEWIPEFDGKFTGGAYWFSCSKCKRIVPEVRNGGWNFCPNCGADMRGEQDE